MQRSIYIVFKGIIFLKNIILKKVDDVIGYLVFYVNGVQFSTFINSGWPRIHVGLGGTCIIGPGFRSNNREMSNPIGRFHKCSIIVGKNGRLMIGNNVGISSTAIVCHDAITIGNNVNIGGNVVIYDTDFHSIKAADRLISKTDKENTKTMPVIIGNDVFIGAHSTILKGVTIGKNAIIGAGSLISKDIPDNEIWAGNPAQLIRKIYNIDSDESYYA